MLENIFIVIIYKNPTTVAIFAKKTKWRFLERFNKKESEISANMNNS